MMQNSFFLPCGALFLLYHIFCSWGDFDFFWGCFFVFNPLFFNSLVSGYYFFFCFFQSHRDVDDRGLVQKLVPSLFCLRLFLIRP